MPSRLTTAAAFAAGIVFGGAALHTVAARANNPTQSPTRIDNPRGVETVTDVSFPGRREGFLVTDLGIYFAPSETELEDITPLGAAGSSQPGRFVLETSADTQDFYVLDTQTGVTTWYDIRGDRVRLYNTTTPNRVLSAELVVNSLKPSD